MDGGYIYNSLIKGSHHTVPITRARMSKPERTQSNLNLSKPEKATSSFVFARLNRDGFGTCHVGFVSGKLSTTVWMPLSQHPCVPGSHEIIVVESNSATLENIIKRRGESDYIWLRVTCEIANVFEQLWHANHDVNEDAVCIKRGCKLRSKLQNHGVNYRE